MDVSQSCSSDESDHLDLPSPPVESNMLRSAGMLMDDAEYFDVKEFSKQEV